MLSAFGRLIAITIGCLSLVLLCVLFIRQLGSVQSYSPPPHPWFELPEWSIYAPPATQLCAAPQKGSPYQILAVPVRFRDGEWRVTCPDNAPAIGDFLAQSTHRDWLLLVEATDTQHLDSLTKAVGEFDKTKRFAIASSSQKVARYLRKKAPQWLFAADSASLLRLHLFTSMWIEPAIDFWPDFVITSDDVTNPAHLTASVAREVERRKKRIIWDSTHGQKQPEFNVHGRITDRVD